jgi:hypothetical protein
MATRNSTSSLIVDALAGKGAQCVSEIDSNRALNALDLAHGVVVVRGPEAPSAATNLRYHNIC